ncbi:alpha/beta hydrolase [Myxococcus sp. K15C18031901]|uniref:alpha/beta hydrolase family protein n=1 Tax=Myxococcus dinghuensis TaxID=2906761 RepID=UPI0020A72E5E|nr:alpha/beta hydrolase [Myxococcus dinghuensis]MCP3103729.1 alpha/beta hydrolase [Myxococcus dinghuensis]
MSSSEWILEAAAPSADVRIPYGPGPHHFGDLRLPAGPGPHPVVVALHGGFWRAKYDLSHLGHLCAALTAEGFATWSLEFRRIGHEGGAFPGTLADAALGADFLRTLAGTHGLDLARVVVLGHSAGGHLALWLGARHRLPAADPLHVEAPLRPKGVVALAAVSDLARAFALRLGDGVVESFVGGSPEAVPERYRSASPAELQPLGIPQVLVHGTDDDTVPVSLSEEFTERGRALGDDVRQITLAGAGHFEVVDPRSAEWPLVLQAVRSLA